MTFPPELENAAIRTGGGEYAWQRSDARNAAIALAKANFAILGGELWLVRDGETCGILPRRQGPPSVYHWECEREAAEGWLSFVNRCLEMSLSAIESLPGEGEVELNRGEIFYNLTWAAP